MSIVSTPFVYWAIVCVAASLFIFGFASTWFNHDRTLRSSNVAVIDIGSALLLFLALRWPVLFHINPFIDELQMVAQAITARHYPIPWLSFDGTTSGPINTYLLIAPSLAGIPISTLGARLMATIGAALLIAALYAIVAPLYGRRYAYATMFPFIVLFGLAMSIDLIMYASELPAMVLTTISLAVAAAFLAGWPMRSWAIALSGLCCGAMPFAKLQASPIALATALCVAAALIWKRQSASTLVRPLALFALSLCTPAICIMVPVVLSGALHDFNVSYIRQGLFSMHGTSATLSTAFIDVPEFQPFFVVNFMASGALAAMLGFATLRTSAGESTRGSRTFRNLAIPGTAFILLGIAWYCIRAPHRDYAHYFLLALIPLSILTITLAGTLSNEGSPRLKTAVSTIVVAYTLLFGFWSLRIGIEPRNALLASITAGPATAIDAPAAAIAGLRSSTDRVAIWGYSPQLYVDSNSIMGTRDAISQFAIMQGDYQNYYRQRFLSDMEKNRPALFVDSTGPADFAFKDRAAYGYETYPPLAAYIRDKYAQVSETAGIRIFRRPRTSS